jgi:hypothetical protein
MVVIEEVEEEIEEDILDLDLMRGKLLSYLIRRP